MTGDGGRETGTGRVEGAGGDDESAPLKPPLTCI